MTVKTYMGIPASPGVPAAVSVVGDGSRKLAGDFAWGKNQPKGGDLALAILRDHVGEPEATRYYRRFMWRTVVNWDKDRPFTLTGEEIDAVLAEIRETDKGIAGQRSKVLQEPAPIAREGGIGPGGVPFSPIEKKS